jgi:hypothetical protein
LGAKLEIRRVRSRITVRGGLLALSLAAAAFLTACGGVAGTVATAVEDSASAIATARLALAQDSAGKLTRAATSTALEDALKELQASRNSVLKLEAATAGDRAARQEALAVLDGCAASLATAVDAVASGDGSPSLDDGGRELAAAADSLSRLAAKAGAR